MSTEMKTLHRPRRLLSWPGSPPATSAVPATNASPVSPARSHVVINVPLGCDLATPGCVIDVY